MHRRRVSASFPYYDGILLILDVVSDGVSMHVFAANPPATFVPAAEDRTSIDPRITHVLEFIQSTIVHVLPASINRIEALINAVLYIERTKGYPRYQVWVLITHYGPCMLNITLS
jgi:hypothetical protein